MKQQKLFNMKHLLIIMSLVLLGCSDESTSGKLLEGEHYLRNLSDTPSNSYFLVDNSNYANPTNTKLSFSFQVSDGSYTMVSLPLHKIRVKFYDYIDVPYVTFRWTKAISPNAQYIMDNHVIYMVVHCKENDFPKI